MRIRPDRISLLFLGLALLAIVLFATSYRWYGEWVVYRSATRHFRLLSNYGGLSPSATRPTAARSAGPCHGPFDAPPRDPPIRRAAPDDELDPMSRPTTCRGLS